MLTRILFYLVCACLLHPDVAMGSNSINNFFPNVKANLTKITWAHAVNNRTYLQQTLNDDAINMIEADILLGQVNGTGQVVPIMGHPPTNRSDLSLEDFLTTVNSYNQDKKHNATRRGVKLDFKSIEVFINSIDIIQKIYNSTDYPIWINADIIPGPVNASTTPVDADAFLTGSRKFTKSVLSLGWTTNYGRTPNIIRASYSDAQINNMTAAIHKNNVTQDITFAVRAGIVAESLSQVKLLKKISNSTLTVWSSEGDYVDVDKLKKVILEYGVDRVYVDVPDELRKRLDLGGSSGGNFSHDASIVTLAISVLVAISTF